MRKPIDPQCNSYAKISRKPNSKRLYIYLKCEGLDPYEKSTGLRDSPENRAAIQRIVDDVNADIQAGVFRFESLFPGAPANVQAKFSRHETRVLRHSPKSVTFHAGVETWRREAYPKIANPSTQRDYNSILKARILPYFGKYRFDEITNTEVKGFFQNMPRTLKGTSDKGKDKSMRNTLIVLRKVWDFINEKFRLNLPSPLEGMNKYITEITRGEYIKVDQRDPDYPKKVREFKKQAEEKAVRVILFSTYRLILNGYKDKMMKLGGELMFLTGMIPSEVGALTQEDVVGSHIIVNASISRGVFQPHTKNHHRTRKIPITRAIRRVLDEALAVSTGEVHIFSSPQAALFNERTHRTAWYNACAAAGIEPVVPYASRHSFVAYGEMMGIKQSRLVALMGHADKSMIDTVYGKYIEGLEKDTTAIKDYYGKDFWNTVG